jgi:hypothetical protein
VRAIGGWFSPPNFQSPTVLARDNKKIMKIRKVTTAEQFEKVIAAYRIQNPVKAAKKEAQWALKLKTYRAGEQVEAPVEPVEAPVEPVEAPKVVKTNKK